MEDRRCRLIDVECNWLETLFLLGCVLAAFYFGYLSGKSMASKSKPHVAEIYCTQERVGKVFAVYSNHPFVDVKEYDSE